VTTAVIAASLTPDIHPDRPGRFFRLPAMVVLAILTGCTSGTLNAGRETFYLGRFTNAAAVLQDLPDNSAEQVLPLMERGMAHQAAGNYMTSIRDWLAAKDQAEQLDYYSVSRGGASLLISDHMLHFTGAPYERTLLHAFMAKSFMALDLWDNAAVEGRNIALRVQDLDGFPDDAYSRYVAGFSFEMIRDWSNAELQYRNAARLLDTCTINESSGRIYAVSNPPPDYRGPELVCFVSLGRAPTEHGSWAQRLAWGSSPYIELYAGEQLLGRSHTLATTRDLMAETDKKLAVMRAARTVTRVILKETAAHAVEEKNPFLGEIVRLLLYSLETDTIRRWETLPLWLQVARVPCPAKLESFRVVFRGAGGQILTEQTIVKPLSHRDTIHVSFIRAL